MSGRSARPNADDRGGADARREDADDAAADGRNADEPLHARADAAASAGAARREGSPAVGDGGGAAAETIETVWLRVAHPPVERPRSTEDPAETDDGRGLPVRAGWRLC